MIVVKVEYTVNEKYVETNKQLIEAFLRDFKELDHTEFLYSVFRTQGGNTFVHLSQYKNPQIQQTLLNTPSFLHFQEQRDKNLVSQPEIKVLEHIGTSKEVL